MCWLFLHWKKLHGLYSSSAINRDNYTQGHLQSKSSQDWKPFGYDICSQKISQMSWKKWSFGSAELSQSPCNPFCQVKSQILAREQQWGRQAVAPWQISLFLQCEFWSVAQCRDISHWFFGLLLCWCPHFLIFFNQLWRAVVRKGIWKTIFKEFYFWSNSVETLCKCAPSL